MLQSAILFSSFFHFIGHLIVMMRIYQPSQKWLINHRTYFIWDMITPLLFVLYINTSFILMIMEIPHFIIHLYYVLSWNNTYYAKRIRDWSSKEYRGKIITPDLFLTLYDVTLHGLCFYLNVFKLFGY